MGSELRRWAKRLFGVVPGRLGSSLRRRGYGFLACGRDVYLGEGLWVEYPNFAKVGEHVVVNQNCFINAGGGVTIGDWVLIGPGVTIYSQNHDISQVDVPLAMTDDVRAPVSIGEGVWLAANCTVLAGVTIGEGAVVAAGAVVTKNVPDFAVVGGVPARVIRMRPAKMS
ncbi:MAG: acyltransferase [Actinobacteria bacterium]|nr:MAG: acyltransferase [Actinomycetota bacterium]